MNELANRAVVLSSRTDYTTQWSIRSLREGVRSIQPAFGADIAANTQEVCAAPATCEDGL